MPSLTGSAPNPGRTIPAGAWTTVEFALRDEAVTPFTGNGILESATGKGVLEALAIVPAAGSGTYNVYLDNFVVAPARTLTWTLDPGAPAGAAINPTNGLFTWTPSEAQGPGSYSITVRATDNGVPALNGTRTFSITVNEVNSPPVITPVPDQAILDGQTLTLTVSASDADVPANTKAFSLDAAPAGAAINPTTGQFTWTAAPAPATTLNNFESATLGEAYGFREPRYSGTTDQNLQPAPNIMEVVTNISGNTTKLGKFQFAWTNASTTNWVRLTTDNAAGKPNPYVDLDKLVRFDVYSTRAIKLCLSIRETGGSGPIGANGGNYGGIEWVGATITNQTASVAPGGKAISAGARQTVTFDLKGDHAESLVGSNTNTGTSANGVVEGNWGTLESLAATAGGSANLTNTIYVDNFKVVTKTNYTVTVTVRVTDNGMPALSSSETFTITVYSSPVRLAQATGAPDQQLAAQLAAPLPPTIIQAAGNDATFTFTFATESGRRYDVEFTETLAPGQSSWQLLCTVVGDGRPAVVAEPVAHAAQRFYRVRVR